MLNTTLNFDSTNLNPLESFLRLFSLRRGVGDSILRALLISAEIGRLGK